MKNNIPEKVAEKNPNIFFVNFPEFKEFIAYLSKHHVEIPSSMILKNTSFRSKESLREFTSQAGIKCLYTFVYNPSTDSYKITEIGKEWAKYC